ncbi:unnamed protein product [Phaedon cochleariae]|uniref:BRCA1-associated ATM activator 1 n=1 Tax=Phaedon cochleariae TaxID=80249 RepID=A0A9N9X595_PHACE|nr:unnamed protein product [Phaedon cochleariae]
MVTITSTKHEMTMAQPVNPRIEKVLNKLLEPNFKLKDDAYLNLLLTHLTSKSNEDNDAIYQQEANKEFILLWMKQAILYWEETETISSTLTCTFALNLMGYMCKDEHIFLKMNQERMFERLLAIIIDYFKCFAVQPSIELAYIKLLSSFLNHASGLQWIISNEHWKFVMNSSLNPHTVYISREGYKFMASMLEKSTIVDSNYAKDILHSLLTPLINARSQTSENGTAIVRDEEALYHSISPILSLLTKMLETFMESKNEGNIKDIILMLEEHFDLEKTLRDLTTFVKKEDFLFDLYKILTIWCFLIVYIKYSENLVVFYGKIENQLIGIFYDATSQLNVSNMLKLCHLSLIYWNNMKSKIPASSNLNSSEISLENQLLVLQIFPAFAMRKCITDEDEHYRSLFLQKFFSKVPPHTLRVWYKWRMHLKDTFSLSDGILALKYFLHSKQFYYRENAVLAFQCLIYFVKDITDLLYQRPDLIHGLLGQPDYIILILECMKVIIDEFTITWKESVETLCILCVTNSFLSVTIWPPKIVISSLQLMEKALVKHMTPEMALLIDTGEDSTINSILTMLKAKLHDSDWEVRDSAVEMVRTVIVSAYTKFSSFGERVVANEFPTSILLMATRDGNSFVRATSLKCLQEMTKVDELWNVLIHEGHILEKIIRILYVEQEGIVRTEAAALIDSIYTNREVSVVTLSKFYDIMHHAVIADLHWETRVNALQFWKNVINRHLFQQGMIDGDFPEFTFSKEKRKIINLNEVEVKMRLIKVLNQLSENGCLSAFQFALQDDCDLEVTKYATDAVNDFVLLLKKYRITTCDVSTDTTISKPSHHSPQPDTSKSQPNRNFASVNSSCSSSNDSVMDEVLDSLDANLLESIFNSLDQPPDDFVEMQGRRMLSPNKFLESVYSDLAYHVEQKSNWIESIDNFNSLLDDILKEYDVNEINEMDCY